MENLLRLCLPLIAAALLLTAERTAAQETFAPLLTKDTTLFVHVDFKKVDLDAVKAEAKKLGETLLTNLAFDARSKRLTLRDLDLELEKWDTVIRPAFELITKELGIQEIAWICDDTWMEGTWLPFAIAIPWKGKTDEDIQKLLSILYVEPAYSLPIGDFLFLGGSVDGEGIGKYEQFLTKWVQNAAADNSSPVLQALKSLPKSDEIKVVVTVPKSLQRDLQNVPFPPDMPIQVRNLIFFAVNKMEWAAASVPVSEFLAGKELKGWRWATVKMPNDADAKMLREMLESAIDGGIDAARQANADAGTSTPPLFFEFFKGLLQTQLPAVEGDTLIFQWNGSMLDVAFVGSAYGMNMLWFLYMRMIERIPNWSGKNETKKSGRALAHRFRENGQNPEQIKIRSRKRELVTTGKVPSFPRRRGLLPHQS